MTLKRSPMKNVPAIIPELVLEVDEPDWNGTTIFRTYLNQRGFKFTRAGKKVTHIKKTKPIIPTIRDMILHNRCLENKERRRKKINENETKKQIQNEEQ